MTRWILLGVVVGVVGLGAQPTVDPNLFPTADNPIYLKVAALENAITAMKGYIQTAIAVAPKNTARRVLDPLRSAVALAEKTEEQWWRWGRPRASGSVDSTLASKPLFQEADLDYVGGFRTPDVVDNDFSGEALAFYDGKLYMQAHFWSGSGTPSNVSKVMQINIPAAVDTGTLASMNVASQLQAPVDITEGNIDEVGGTEYGQFRNWGLIVYSGKLYGSAYMYYDSGTQAVSHFGHSLTLATASFEGWMAVWDPTRARYTSGPMATVPAYAQTALGGPVITTGAGSASHIGHLSVGHSAYAIDPSEITGRTPFTLKSSQPLMYFTTSNAIQDNYQSICEFIGPTVGCEDDPSEIWNRATSIGGVVIPEGYRTAIYFGAHGPGEYCYGQGTTNEKLHGTSTGSGDNIYCYDPVGNFQGEHAYPYRYQVWLFDLLDWAAVKAGTKQPWQVLPYDQFELILPVSAPTNVPRRIGGVAYDAANKTIYVSQVGVDQPSTVSRSVIWKYTHP